MKTIKPRNYVALAMINRSGAGAHQKSNKAKRAESKRQLQKELKEPPNKTGGIVKARTQIGNQIY